MAAGNADAIRQTKAKERDEAIRLLCDICGREEDGKQPSNCVRGGTRPLRIVIVGRQGAGKSSFINGVAAALAEDRWREHAYTGFRGRGAPITIANQKFDKCCNGQMTRYQNVYLPTLIDGAGLSDEEDDKMEELLRLLFYGHIQEDEAVMKVFEECRKATTEQIRRQYSQCYPEMRVDRVVFVASAADPLPERLMACVLHAARPSHHMDVRRAVPIYGVLTKMDKVDVEDSFFKERKRKFIEDLGLNQARVLLCKNYCDDLDPEGQRIRDLDPELDIPYIRFMQQVCDPALSVIREDEILPGSEASAEELLQAEKKEIEARRPAWVNQVMQAWSVLDWSTRLCILVLFTILLVSVSGPTVLVLAGLTFFAYKYHAGRQADQPEWTNQVTQAWSVLDWSTRLCTLVLLVSLLASVLGQIVAVLGGLSFISYIYMAGRQADQPQWVNKVMQAWSVLDWSTRLVLGACLSISIFGPNVAVFGALIFCKYKYNSRP